MSTIDLMLPDRREIEGIARALGESPAVAYSTSHVYPWAAPNFATRPEAERPRPPLETLRLYVHVPFCRYACTYCSYAIKVGAGLASMERYVDAVRRELEWIEHGTPLAQLFVGGGTPTALPPDLLGRLLHEVFARSPSLGSEVHTVEASPETITAGHLDALRAGGVGRVSMGVQSLDDGVLDGVHRRHSPEQALAACELLVGSGLLANVDLIYGLPGQSEESFRRDLALVVERGVHSVTLYDLRVNERTAVVKSLADHERLVLERLMRWRAVVAEAAREVGLVQTRWHTFRRPAGPATGHRRAAHFQADGWGFQLGVGMSARSQLGYVVYRNHPQLAAYLGRVEKGRSPVEEVFELGHADRKTQFVARSLGDGRPLARPDYRAAFGVSIEDDFGAVIARLRDAGLVDDDGTALTLSRTGRLVYDRVTLCFYPAEARTWLYARRLSGAAAR